MPVTPTYPGVYVEEIPSGVRTITGVATSITAFIGRAFRGPTDEPILINSYGEYERIFGGLFNDSTMSFAVRDFYTNGGSQAVIVRLFNPKELQATTESEFNEVKSAVEAILGAGNKQDGILAAWEEIGNPDNGDQPNIWEIAEEKVTENVAKQMAIEIYALPDGLTEDDYTKEVDKIIAKLQIRAKAQLSVGTDNVLVLEAANEGSWGNELRARVDYDGLNDNSPLFNLSVRDGGTGEVETFQNVSVDPNQTRYIEKVLEKDSQLVRIIGTLPSARPEKNPSTWDEIKNQIDEELQEQEKRKFRAEGVWYELSSNGVKPIDHAGDGDQLTSTNFTEGEGEKEGIYALEKADLFNLLCIPPYKQEANGLDVETGVIEDAIIYCEKRRAMMILDSPSGWNTKGAAKSGIDGDVGSTSPNAAVFFPRLKMPNPLKENQMETFSACGAVAGIFARTDATRGVWKAPAGLDAVLRGVAGVSVPLTDPENGELNPKGINCLRNRPPAGKIVWGSRTRVGDDMLASEWKYIPVRRLALYLEETLYRNTKWAVFEPNDEPLWSQLRLSIGSFMQNLFKQGAFQGSSPKDAYFVKCDKETTTQYDIDRGIVNIMIGFAPLKPAEFVILKFQQIAGQS
ncbi:phage tail sheath C-terminal domain-containing protein [Moorena sp. SIO4G3]|uniref:phage tail sheath family protein n=1 Tax=Moorena sp. SIO4G3 TaxID=2607821 RepID=UPI0014296AB3|nr:phage tail sheath C-terminal domain-containing protein [Moorena sp. SIO4G3]NEO78349.1 phage tail sheath family protein [Moorena sp. SIO4G3]